MDFTEPLTKIIVNGSLGYMDAVDVIDNPAAALVARLGIARQKLNYHLRTLEAHHLVREAETRKWGGLQERLLVASAGSYIVSPAALGPAGATPERVPEHLSASYLLVLAGRVVTEVGAMLHRSRRTNTPLATLAL